MDDTQATRDSFVKAYALAPQFQNLAAYAVAGHLAAGDRASADDLLRRVYGTTQVDNDILAVAYYRTKNWPRLISLWKLRATASGASVESWFSLAAAYYMSGNKPVAIETITKAIALFPHAATSGEAAIKQIQEGK